jgi:eukaryotic-like serine/threonine-protein kinase
MEATGAAARTGRLPQIAKYEVLEEIGHGGMATVYRARDPVLARDVAIKVIHPHLRDSAEIAHRFSVEARAVAKLRHPNIVEVFDVSREDEPEQYLVVELLRGFTLRKLLQKRSPLAPEVAASIGVELASALAHAHEQDVVHRDTKPENVILERRGGPDSTPRSAPGSGDGVLVKLTDFGIAKLLDAQGVTSTGQVLGSPAHMAPEQIEGGEVDARADVFALGVLLYECMVGHLPFEGNNPAQVLRRVLDGQYPSAEAERPTVGRGYSTVLDRALAHLPADRFASAAELGGALTRELARLGVDSPRAEIAEWLDDADAYDATHTKRAIDRLCANAAIARKRGDAIAAAADYNRALAYAPDDPALLKIVTGIQRREARLRAVKNGGRAALVMALVGTAGFGVTRVVRDRIDADHSTNKAVVSAGPLASAPPASAAPSTAPPASAPPSATSSGARVAALPTVKSAVTAVATKRDVAVDVAFPPNGVLASIDGAAAVPVSGGYTFNVDNKAHSIVFTCVEDLCVPKRVDVPAGDDGVPVSASLTIRPASLVVHGDANASYQILQLPQLTVRAETAVSVPLKDSKKTFTVVQLPSGKKLVVELAAGKRGEVTFGD